MGAAPSRCEGVTEDCLQPSGAGQEDSNQPISEKDSTKRTSWSRRCSSADTVHCPTCQGTGRIPRGSEPTHMHVWFDILVGTSHRHNAYPDPDPKPKLNPTVTLTLTFL